MENNKEKKSKKWILIIVAMLAVAAVIILLMLGLSGKKGGGATVPTTDKAALSVDVRSMLLNSGESKQITVANGEEVTFSSSNTSVAKVDENGVVTALAKGNAMITITSGKEIAYCGVIVDAMGSMVDVSKQKATAVFSDLMLKEPGAITGLAVDIGGNAFYLGQSYGTSAYVKLPSDIIVNKVSKENGTWKMTEWMRFYESGTGRIAIEKKGIDTYLLTESSGTYYGSGATLSRIGWQNEGFGQEEFGETFAFEGVTGSASPAVDSGNNLLMIYDNVKKSYLIYDRDALGSGENVYLHEVVCKNGQEPVAGVDDSQGFYNATVRDFAIANGYIYQICGSSSMYISVFDLNGTLQYCYRVPDYADMEVRMPGGIACEGGKVYIAVGSENSSYYFGNVWMFQ